MILLDVIDLPRQTHVIVDTVVRTNEYQDTIAIAEETATGSGGSATLMWAISALLAALAACLYALFFYRHRVAVKE